MEKSYVVDIDSHILFSEIKHCECCGRCNYLLKSWDREEIQKMNTLFLQGSKIHLYTGRGWDLFDITVEQLDKAGVMYHSLTMGKPLGAYIDKESRRSISEFVGFE